MGGTQPTRHVYSGSAVRAILAPLGDRRTYGRAYNLAQEETPTLGELLAVLAELLGADPRLVPVPAERLRAEDLDPVRVFALQRAVDVLARPVARQGGAGFRHPLRPCLDKIVTAFLAHPPAEPLPANAEREAERTLAARLA